MYNYEKKNIRLAKNLRKNMTPQERKLWYEFLRNYEIHIYRQKLIGNYILDFYCAWAKLAIELDVSQHFMGFGQNSDKIRDSELSKQNIIVLRYSNEDVNKIFTVFVRILIIR